MHVQDPRERVLTRAPPIAQLADGKLKCAPLLNDLCAFKTQRRLPIADTRLTIHPRCIPPSPTPERPSRILALYSGQKAFMSGKLKVKGNSEWYLPIISLLRSIPYAVRPALAQDSQVRLHANALPFFF